ncbi:MAG: tetratricopeptide repeat protein, partial [Anaerolineae bacterium]|nr:tetratricopeptide repeat protein [Anaerolineae bacterium]
QDAIQVYHRAAEVTPRRSYPQINLAMLYLHNNDLNNAEKYRQSAEAKARRRLEDTPEDYWAWHDVALSQLLGGNANEAMRYFSEGIELSPDINSLESVLSRLIYIKHMSPDLDGIDLVIQHFRDAIRQKS